MNTNNNFYSKLKKILNHMELETLNGYSQMISGDYRTGFTNGRLSAIDELKKQYNLEQGMMEE